MGVLTDLVANVKNKVRTLARLEAATLRRVETIGCPLGNPAFLAQIEAVTGRTLRPAKPGPHKAES